MTLIAGFPEHPDFVLLAAESEESGTDGIGKGPVRKILVWQHEDCKLLVGGAGDADFIVLAQQMVLTEMLGTEFPFSVASIMETLHAVTLQLHERIDKSYDSQDRPDHEFHLLSAIWVKGEGLALVKTTRGSSFEQTEPVSIGVGSYLSRYLIDILYMRNLESRSLTSVRRLAAYILHEVKAYTEDVGGRSQIVWIDKDGNVERASEKIVTRDELDARMLTHVFFRTLLQACDDNSVADKLRAALERIWLEKDQAKARAQQDPQPPKGDS